MLHAWNFRFPFLMVRCCTAFRAQTRLCVTAPCARRGGSVAGGLVCEAVSAWAKLGLKRRADRGRSSPPPVIAVRGACESLRLAAALLRPRAAWPGRCNARLLGPRPQAVASDSEALALPRQPEGPGRGLRQDSLAEVLNAGSRHGRPAGRGLTQWC